MDDEIHDEDASNPESPFVIANLGPLSDRFRPDDSFLARGPFKVHSPRSRSWAWGYNLQQVGEHLHFHDGSALGRSIMTDGMSVRATDDGSIIWFFGFEDDGLTVITLTAATHADYRDAAPSKVAFTSFEDGARVIAAELETKRRALFGITMYHVLASRFALVFEQNAGAPVFGLYHFGASGVVRRRVNRGWVACDLEAQPWYRNEDALLAPFLSSGIADFDRAAACTSRPFPRGDLKRFIYPNFDIDGPEDWQYFYREEWAVVD